MANRPATISTRMSHPVMRAIRIMERQGWEHKGLCRFVNSDGERASIRQIRPGLFKVTYEERAEPTPVRLA